MAINTTLKRNLQDVYLVKFVKATEIGEADTYAEPVHYKLNVITKPDNADIVQFGTAANNMIKIVDSVEILKDFKVGDRIYYDKPIPKEHDVFQEGTDCANYEIIQDHERTLNVITIRLKKIYGK